MKYANALWRRVSFVFFNLEGRLLARVLVGLGGKDQAPTQTLPQPSPPSCR